MRSMTGYGRSQAESDGNSVTVEISSVNSRTQIDMRFSIPRELGMLEPEFRRLVQQQLSRGSFQVAVTYQLKPEARQASAKVDVELVQHLARQLREAGRAAGLREAEPSWHDLLLIPGVVMSSDATLYEPLRELALTAFQGALSDLERSRREEGQRLQADLLARGETIRELVEQIASRESEAQRLQKERLQERLAGLGLDLPIDDEKLSREVIFYVEKADITEETVRLRAHLERYGALLNSEGDPGRDLDFLGQEMGREANTLSAKTADLPIAEAALRLKTELGRIREQIMNIE